MGIPFYYTHIVRTYKHIIKKLEKLSCQFLFLDSNSIIYNSCVGECDENIIINKVILEIEELVNLFKSSHTYIAFDGVPPLAKINQQRNRRYKSKFQKRILNEYENWDTCAITPGSLFMANLNNELKRKYMKKSNIYLSTSHDVGEGEHKIFKYIRENSKKLQNEEIIIYGLDADLIMLSLYHVKFVKNIFLYRETPDFIKHLNIDMNQNEKYLLDIAELKKVIEKSCHVNDYMFLCFLLGNDFLPHFPSLNIRKDGITKLVNIYQNVGEKIVTIVDGVPYISWKSFRLIINELAKSEKDEFVRIINEKKNLSKVYKTKEELFNNIPSIERSTECMIDARSENWVNNYYKFLFEKDFKNNKNEIYQIASNYLEGLEWTLKYYIGYDIDWNWCYNYNYPPLFTELLDSIPFYDVEFTFQSDNKFTEMMLLCYVLPYNSLDLIPSEIRERLKSSWYETNCEINWAYCKYFWEAHVILPNIDVNELKYCLH